MDGSFQPFIDESDIETLKAQHEETLSRAMRRAKARERRAWARGLLDGTLAQMGPDCVALDCGANVGEVTQPLADTGAMVYAFEPDPVAFAALSERMAGYDNVQLVNAAVGETAGTATLHRSVRFDEDPLAATVSSTLMAGKRDADAEDPNGVAVAVLSLPDILSDVVQGRVPRALPRLPGQRRGTGRCALLKIDIEGGELSLLPALHDADLLQHVSCTLVETHQRKFPALRRDFLQMRREIGGLYPSRKVNLDWI